MTNDLPTNDAARPDLADPFAVALTPEAERLLLVLKPTPQKMADIYQAATQQSVAWGRGYIKRGDFLVRLGELLNAGYADLVLNPYEGVALTDAGIASQAARAPLWQPRQPKSAPGVADVHDRASGLLIVATSGGPYDAPTMPTEGGDHE